MSLWARRVSSDRVVENGRCVTVDLPRVVEEHNRHARRLAAAAR